MDEKTFDESFKKPALDYMEKYGYELFEEPVFPSFTFICPAGGNPRGHDGWQSIYDHLKYIDELVENNSISELRDWLEGDYSRIPYGFASDEQIRSAIRYKEKEMENPRLQPNWHEGSRMEERKMAEEKNMVIQDENEKKKWLTIDFLEENAHYFTGKDLKPYISINAGEGYEFIRPEEQILRIDNDEQRAAFRLPDDYECTLKRSKKDETGNYVTEEIKINAKSLAERIKKNDDMSQFVNISVSKKRVVNTFNVTTEKGPVEYSIILAPGGISYIRPSEKLKKDNFNEGHVYFTMHKDNIIKCQRRTDEVLGVTDTGKNIYKVENFEMHPEELKELYVIEKRINAPSPFYEQQPEKLAEIPMNVIDPVDKIIGKIEFLGLNGKVREAIEYTNADMFKKNIKEETECGVPINIVIYKDKNGNHIQTDFLAEIDFPIQSIKMEELTDNAYSETNTKQSNDELPIATGKSR